MLKCKEVHHLVASGHDEDMSLMGRLEMRVHLFVCKHCRNYVRQMRAIGEAMRSLWADRHRKDEAASRLQREITTKIGANHDHGDR